MTPRDINLIANKEEKYISFDKQIFGIKLSFIDTIKFISESLQRLAENLPHVQFHAIDNFFFY